ncbi:nucleoside triphosphate pyrophosphohydrolase [Paenibacillus sp. BIHB 4019]|uniref:nucleoside triphosphate pyrophosphohydrolase n=1 Tax=Paenibacillus sp. BIHB 4019 TaxID=1870819 RepID=UPI000C1566AB|nr:nucleoside triphosphate pyrophosphohydrolase [Paenibacillus sp. BIHB 4019]
MKTYNKLVRDNIPQIIQASGKQFSSRVLNTAEYEIALKEKIQEELNEFLEAGDQEEQLEELADLLEVIYSFAHSKGIGREQMELIRERKKDERGGFYKRICLMNVFDHK